MGGFGGFIGFWLLFWLAAMPPHWESQMEQALAQKPQPCLSSMSILVSLTVAVVLVVVPVVVGGLVEDIGPGDVGVYPKTGGSTTTSPNEMNNLMKKYPR